MGKGNAITEGDANFPVYVSKDVFLAKGKGQQGGRWDPLEYR